MAGPLTLGKDLSVHTYSVITHADRQIGVGKMTSISIWPALHVDRRWRPLHARYDSLRLERGRSIHEAYPPPTRRDIAVLTSHPTGSEFGT